MLFSLQKIAEQKLQAFAIGTMGQRPLSRREQEERRKKEEEQAAASVKWTSIILNFSLLISLCQVTDFLCVNFVGI